MTNEELNTALYKKVFAEAFVKERNEALFSPDRKKIEAYMIKYGETEIAQTPDVVFWASVTRSTAPAGPATRGTRTSSRIRSASSTGCTSMA